ncbi:Hypothetical predicted protein [Cloeon dipterum]|uniref:Mitochondrial-processing peptidase subunit alpha n=1 Tax=Cloeon dipterum TaxID=197152 RepID=A0A8S1D0N5_9INSE|nr:Hypothetical predicted protein [Cloeon dipterum]
MAARTRISSTFSRILKPKFRRNEFRRSLCSSNGGAVAPPPLSQALPGLPSAVFASPGGQTHETRVTRLSNGMRIATEDNFGQFCTVGVVIDAGCRYEVAYPSGVSHFLEKLAFSSSAEYEDRDHIMQVLEEHGGICDCQSSRDTFIYAASADTRGVDNVVSVLADTVLRPRLTDQEVDFARMTVQFELETLAMRPEQETILTDMVHAAAFQDNTLGLPKICPEANLGRINRHTLLSFLSRHFVPERMVLAGVGVPHEQLVAAAEKHFAQKRPAWTSGQGPEVDTSFAQWTGGIQLDETRVPQHAGPSGLPELAHMVIGLEAVGHQDDDFVAVCVLNMMMGGGGSFSAGGPGKGMYTRLYTNVLNRYHWMYNATAYNHAYSDTGLFCIHASAPPSHLRQVAEVIIKEMVGMAGSVGKMELERAKTQLQSMLLMNLEARPVIFEDIGRQVLATGERKRPEYFMKQISQISETDIARVAKRLLKSSPAVAARGDLTKMPLLSDLQAGLLDETGKMPSKLGRGLLFR